MFTPSFLFSHSALRPTPPIDFPSLRTHSDSWAILSADLISYAIILRKPQRWIRGKQTNHSVIARSHYNKLPFARRVDWLLYIHVPQWVRMLLDHDTVRAAPHTHATIFTHADSQEMGDVATSHRLHLHDKRVLLLHLRLTRLPIPHIWRRLTAVKNSPLSVIADHFAVVSAGQKPICRGVEWCGGGEMLPEIIRAATADTGVVASLCVHDLPMPPETHCIPRNPAHGILHTGRCSDDCRVVESSSSHGILHPIHLRNFTEISQIPHLGHIPWLAIRVQNRPTIQIWSYHPVHVQEKWFLSYDPITCWECPHRESKYGWFHRIPQRETYLIFTEKEGGNPLSVLVDT